MFSINTIFKFNWDSITKFWSAKLKCQKPVFIYIIFVSNINQKKVKKQKCLVLATIKLYN